MNTARQSPPRLRAPARPDPEARPSSVIDEVYAGMVKVLGPFDSTRRRSAPGMFFGKDVLAGAFLVSRLAPAAGSDVADQLLGRTVHPRLFRALLGVEAPLDAEAAATCGRAVTATGARSTS
jgi:hypothetical protein